MASCSTQRFHTIAVLVVLVAAAGILAFPILKVSVVAQPPPAAFQPTEIRIGPEISGRLLRFPVAPGESVHEDDTLIELSNPELEAALVLAKAELGETRAACDRVYAGPRQEQVDALALQVEKRDLGTVLDKSADKRRANAAGAAGDDHRSAFE